MESVDLQNRIVLVDDEPNNRDTLAFILDAEGFVVDTAVDGSEGLETIRAIKPKVVLLDIMMPRMDGYEVCQAIRSDRELASIFIIVITANGMKLNQRPALEVGADLYMRKPFDEDVLVQVIRAVFESRMVSQAKTAGQDPVVNDQRG